MLRGGPTGTRTKSIFGYSRNWTFKEIILFERNSGLKGYKFSRLLENSFQEYLPEGKTIKKLRVCGRYIWTLPVNGLQVKPIPLLTAWWDWSNWSHHTHIFSIPVAHTNCTAEGSAWRHTEWACASQKDRLDERMYFDMLQTVLMVSLWLIPSMTGNTRWFGVPVPS